MSHVIYGAIICGKIYFTVFVQEEFLCFLFLDRRQPFNKNLTCFRFHDLSIFRASCSYGYPDVERTSLHVPVLRKRASERDQPRFELAWCTRNFFQV